jgi:hypothetical protein
MRLDKVDNHYKNFAAKEMRPAKFVVKYVS